MQILIRIVIAFSFVVYLSACTPSTGIDIRHPPVEPETFKKDSTLYFYRPACFQGSIAKIILEVNNINVGILGTGEILVSEIVKDTSHIVAFGDLNGRNYSLNLQTVSKESRYLLASYCDELIGLKVEEKNFDEWLQIIKKD